MYFSLFFAILSLCSRGVFELLFSKALAYGFSFIIFLFFYMVFCFFTGFRVLFHCRVVLWGGLFCIFAFFSYFLSLYNGVDNVVYFLYPFAFLFFLLFFSIVNGSIDQTRYVNTIVFLAFFIALVGILQQTRLIDLPGVTYTFATFIRPSSTTGSYLHFPLIVVCLTVFIQCYRGVTWYVFVLYLSVFLTFSRSGMLLISLVFVFLFFLLLKKKKRISKKNIIVFSCVLLFFLFSLYYFIDFFSMVFERFYSSFFISSPGNSGRLDAWLLGWELFSNSNLFIGENFGLVTNLTGNLTDSESFVVESGFLQNLINFGFLGTLFFYLVFLEFLFFNKLNVWNCFLLSFLIQSLIYQSTEVLPFLILIILFSNFNRNFTVLSMKEKIYLRAKP